MSQDLVYHSHNHDDCVAQALAQAVAFCKAKDMRLTAVRKQVLTFIWASHKPIGAYDLLPKLAQAGFNSAPPTVYRALDFLLEARLIHRISSLNAFVGCPQPEAQHDNCFFICQDCGLAQELASKPLLKMRRTLEKDLGFKINQQSTEFFGICPTCQSESA